MSKILCIIPPHIPSYFNAGHHISVFLVSNYLRTKYPQISVDAFDFAALNASWKDICDLLLKKYKIIYTMFDYDGADTCERFAYYVAKLSPESHLVALGRLVKEVPLFFAKRGYAAHSKGDYECGAENYLKYYLKPEIGLNGFVTLNTTEEEIKKTKGDWLEPADWVLPKVEEIPYYAYNRMYKNDLNKFCGIPDRQELVVPIARGCPVGCSFCDVHRMQGLKERRLPVDKTIYYIQDSFAKLPFEYFTFYAPTFTLDRKWVKEFCEKKIEKGLNYPWKCVTVLKTLTVELLNLMAKAGCIRVSFGIESFENGAAQGLPRLKRDSWNHFEEICQFAKNNGVEVNVFLILGLPGDNPQSMEHTIRACIQRGIRIRPTIFTPYEKLNDNLTVNEVAAFNRQIFVADSVKEEHVDGFYNLFYNNPIDRPTTVMDKIEKRN